MEIKLHKKFEVTGTNLQSFFSALKDMDKATKVVNVSSNSLFMYSVISDTNSLYEYAMLRGIAHNKNELAIQVNTKNAAKKEDKLMLASMHPSLEPRYKHIPRSRLIELYDGSEVLDEVEQESRLIMKYEDKTYVVSALAINTILNRAGINGNFMYSVPSISRAFAIESAFYLYEPQIIKVVTRENSKGGQIILAIHSEMYCYVNQSILEDIFVLLAADYGKGTCERWKITHNLSSCYITFPDIGKEFSESYNLPDDVIPGIYIATSDSGDSAITVKGCWRIGNSIIGTSKDETCKLQHKGNLDLEKFKNDICNRVFSEIKKVPERLCELLALNISQPANTLYSVMKQVGLEKAIGKKRFNILYRNLCAEFMTNVSYTAYDIAMAIFSLPERCLEAGDSILSKLEDVCYDALSADYNKAVSGNLILLADE